MADSISTFTVNAGAGGAAAGVKLVWRVAMSSCTVWSQQVRPSAGVQSSARKREFERSVRQVRLAERAQMMLHAAKKSGETAVRWELIAHLDCRFRRKACDAHAEGDSRAGECNCLVTTGDVLSCASVTSDPFPAKSTSVWLWSTQCCSAQRVLCESCLAHQVLVVSSLCCQFILVARL